MNEKIIAQFSETLIAVFTVAGIIILLLATWHDLRKISQKLLITTTIKRLKKSHQPYVTILIYVHNNATSIIDCLKSIKASKYSNYRTVVAHNASEDLSTQLVTTYSRRNKRMPITQYISPRPTSRQSVLQEAFHISHGGNLTLILDASDVLMPFTLKEAAARFVLDSNLDSLRLRQVSVMDRNIPELTAQFIHLSKDIIFKAFANHAVTSRSYLDSGIVSRSNVFDDIAYRNIRNVDYGSTVQYVSSPITQKKLERSQSRKIITLQLSLAFVLVSMLSYFLYTAARLQNNALLTLSWLLVVFWLLAVIWADPARIVSRQSKRELTAAVPFMYFVLYVYMTKYVLKLVWRGIKRMISIRFSFESLRTVLRQELYSNRY